MRGRGLTEAQKSEPDWQVVSLLILGAPIRMGHPYAPLLEQWDLTEKFGLVFSILALYGILWQHVGYLFYLASLVGDFGVRNLKEPNRT